MNRRNLQQCVRELLATEGSARAVLKHAAGRMKSLRADSSVDSFPAHPLDEVLRQDDALGQIYQALNTPALEAAYRETSSDRRKFMASEIPAVTQLFTPKWVVEFLLQNTLGTLWCEMHPETRLRAKWNWLVEAGSGSKRENRRATDLRICDPACGTMNFGLAALDMLREMYREEMQWNDPSCSNSDEIDSCILRNNLFGFDIDPLAIELSRESLEIKIGRSLRDDEFQIQQADALYCEIPSETFDVIVTNPPYLSARNLDSLTVAKMKRDYPTGWRDAYTCFILRSLQLLKPGGRLGILCMNTFMFTAAFEQLRRKLGEESALETAAHFGPGLWEVGNPGTLQTVAMTLQKQIDKNRKATFFRLADVEDKEGHLCKAIMKRSSAIRFEISGNELQAMPRGAWMYWLAPAERHIFGHLPKLADISPPRQGLATTDNARFVRYWWEVEPPGYFGPRPKWFTYAKGGRFRRWYESARFRVNWENDGQEIKQAIVNRYPYLRGKWKWVAKNSAWYGKPGITYSYLTSARFSARQLEAGAIFDVAGSALFPQNPLLILGILNSTTAAKLLSAINPTVNCQVGDLGQLPIPPGSGEEICRDVQRAIEIVREFDHFDETSTDFKKPMPWKLAEEIHSELHGKLAKAELRIDQAVAEMYGLKMEIAGVRECQLDRMDLALRWIGYALGIWLGRWGDRAFGDVALVSPMKRIFQNDLQAILEKEAGESEAVEITNLPGGLENCLGRRFWEFHNVLYRSRPVFWSFGNTDRITVVSSLTVDREIMREALRLAGGNLPRGWERRVDDGVLANLAPLTDLLVDREFARTVRANCTSLCTPFVHGCDGCSV